MPNSKPSSTSEVNAPKAQPASPAADKKALAENYPDAITLLTADHKEVKAYFEQYQKLVDKQAESKALTGLAHTICHTLLVHAQIEEEYFYPPLRKSFESAELINEAAVEHTTAKYLIDQILSSGRRDALYDAKVKVLAEYVGHHVREEEDEIFPKAKKLKVDLVAMGEKLAKLKAELLASGQDLLGNKPTAESSAKDKSPDLDAKEATKSNKEENPAVKTSAKSRSV
jgi:hemerythrin superfamily protein